MSVSQPPPRRYQKAGRSIAAQATRDAITRAARTLFAARGFAGTTIDAIAAGAEVAPQTVYAAFGSKAAIAKEFRIHLEREAGIVTRFQRALEEDNPARQIELVAKLGRHICEDFGDVYELLTSAKEPEMAAVGRELNDAQRYGMRLLVQRLADKRALRPGLDREEAATTLWGLSSIDLYRKLVTQGGWTPARFERWLAATLKQLVLDSAGVVSA